VGTMAGVGGEERRRIVPQAAPQGLPDPTSRKSRHGRERRGPIATKTPVVVSGFPRHASRSSFGANRPTIHRRHDRRRRPVDRHDPGSACPGDDRHGGGRDAGVWDGRWRLQLPGRAAAAVAWIRGRGGMRLRVRVPGSRHVSRGCMRPVARPAASPPGLRDPAAGVSTAARDVGRRIHAVAQAAGHAPVPSLRCGDRGRVLTPQARPPATRPIWHPGPTRRHPFTRFGRNEAPAEPRRRFGATGIS
jgi:hypothetical protein